MAQHKSAKKRIRTSERRSEINKMYSSRLKTSVKKALENTDKEQAEKLYKNAVSILDKAVDKGRIKKNTAARRKSSLTKHLNKLQTV
jgi:small subunit ribosomal protein S20